MLTEKDIEDLRKEIEEATRPMYLFDADGDGLSAFLQIYNVVKDGKGISIKKNFDFDEKFLETINEFQPDKIFILDIPRIDEDFLRKIKFKIVWVDHHEPIDFKLSNLKYFNPTKNDKSLYYPTSAICYDSLKKDLWLAVVGCIYDGYIPKYLSEFSEKYPEILYDSKISMLEIKYDSKLGDLVQIFEFLLKGKSADYKKNINILTRIQSPDEIIEQKTPAAKFLHKYYKKIKKDYDQLLTRASKARSEDGILAFIYPHDNYSFTSEIANRLAYYHPDDIVIVGREKAGQIFMSIRSYKYDLRELLKIVFSKIEGYGGGHIAAVGASVNKELYKDFLELIKSNLNLVEIKNKNS